MIVDKIITISIQCLFFWCGFVFILSSLLIFVWMVRIISQDSRTFANFLHSYFNRGIENVFGVISLTLLSRRCFHISKVIQYLQPTYSTNGAPINKHSYLIRKIDQEYIARNQLTNDYEQWITSRPENGFSFIFTYIKKECFVLFLSSLKIEWMEIIAELFLLTYYKYTTNIRRIQCSVSNCLLFQCQFVV